MSTSRQEAQGVVDRYSALRAKVAALEVKERDGSATVADAAFLKNFRRQLTEIAREVIHAKLASGDWLPEKVIERMST